MSTNNSQYKIILSAILIMGLVNACSDSQVSETVPLAFSAEMVPEEVVTGSPEEGTNAQARATLILSGNTLHVHGAFTGLSSMLRDIEETPDDPGIHLHPGARGEENSYIYGLEASLNEDERSGTFTGTFELTDEEMVLLLDDRLYLDMHTIEFDPGEVRGQIEPSDREEAERRLERISISPEEVDASEIATVFCRFNPSLAGIQQPL